MLSASRQRFGSLDCIVVDGGPDPVVAAVICHGYGADGMDLAGLAAEWMRHAGGTLTPYRFVFPEAPHTLEALGMPGGRAWWPIDTLRLAALVERDPGDDQGLEQLQREHPAGIDEATDQLCEAVDAVIEGLPGNANPLVLGGFSQGAMLAMNASLRGAIPAPKLLLLFSGILISQHQWESKLARLAQTQVFQSHGRQDPLLPYASAEALAQWLDQHGVSIEFHTFTGGHTIDPASIAITARMLSRVAETE
jgi:phospholipase/carboxylesterase